MVNLSKTRDPRFWKMEDLLKVFEDKFELIESKEELIGHTNYLGVFLRKMQRYLNN